MNSAPPAARKNSPERKAPQFLTAMDHSYTIGLLRCFAAFPLYASSILDQSVPQTPRVPSGRLLPDGTGCGSSM